MEFEWYAWVILPLIVFVARVADVTLGTLRIIFTSRGRRNIAPLLGFVEVFIWIVVVSQIVKSAQGITSYLGYAGGFATGTYVGMLIEERMAMGTLVLRIILKKDASELTSALREAGYGVTSVDGEGAQGSVKLLYTVVQRKKLAEVSKIIHEVAPRAFFSVEEVQSSEMGIFPPSARR
ncbi:MAG: DUF2179 domain-containing protein [Anaerolineales bacterium]|nr:DUF2179 domain-containing protein [Anaerolineales bacterium]MCB9144384.1 DUF2179 domain-containing protein [Anaerolineales bacterium]